MNYFNLSYKNNYKKIWLKNKIKKFFFLKKGCDILVINNLSLLNLQKEQFIILINSFIEDLIISFESFLFFLLH